MATIYTAGEAISGLYENVRAYDADSGTEGIIIYHSKTIYGLAIGGYGDIFTGDDGTSGNGMRKYTSSGDLVWYKTHLGKAIYAVAADSEGNSYFAGAKTVDPITTRKYDSGGTLQWSKNHGDTVWAICVDNAGNVYTGGAVSSSVTTRKYNSSGTEQWTANHGATVRGITVDSSGNVYTCGLSDGSYTIRKYNSSGTEQWAVDTGGYDYGIALDSSGNIYVCGLEYIKKYNSSGTEITTGGFPITVSSMDLRDLVIDKNNNIFVCGVEYDNKTLIKFNSSGVEQWSKNHGSYYSVYCISLYEPVEIPGLPIGFELGTPTSVVSTSIPALSLSISLAIPTLSSAQEPLDINTLTSCQTLIYRCYIGSDSGNLLEYPMQSLQMRRRRNDSTWLNCKLSGITSTQAETILDCLNNALVVYVGTRENGIETLGEFLYAILTAVEYEQTPFGGNAYLTARVDAVNETLQTRALTGVVGIQNEDGRYKLRCDKINYRLRPGDTVTYGAISFTAYNVNYQILPMQQWMDIQEEPV